MHAINITAVQPPLMLALFGTALGSAVVGVDALADLSDPAARWALVGAALYLLGVLVLTAAYHVPRNSALAQVDPDAPDAAEHWARYAAAGPPGTMSGPRPRSWPPPRSQLPR